MRGWEKDISGCSLSGFINEDGSLINGEKIIRSITVLHDRSNGLGGGFAAYGIYPEFKNHYAFHLLYNDKASKQNTEEFIRDNFKTGLDEPIPTRKVRSIENVPILWRYFLWPKEEKIAYAEKDPDDYVVEAVMHINSQIPGAYVISGGKNMGAFKAVGFPEDVGDFYRLDEYKGYTWISHGRFPTNTPGWWGGAHPFTILDWAIVHNGEISSYGINKRYLEMFGYHCTLLTDTEVMAYLFDLLLRRHKLPIEVAAMAFASPFWDEIDRMPSPKRELVTAIRKIYGSCLVNGPFAVAMAYRDGLIGLNDRVKLRPLVAARDNGTLYLSSEEAGIREICPSPQIVWSPKAGEPVIGKLKERIWED